MTFKDYGFFLPTDCSGDLAYVEGVVKVEVVSRRQAAHLAGESKHPDAEQIRGSFRADGYHAPHYLNPFIHPHDALDGSPAAHRWEGLFMWGAQFEHGPLTPYQARLSDNEWAVVGEVCFLVKP